MGKNRLLIFVCLTLCVVGLILCAIFQTESASELPFTVLTESADGTREEIKLWKDEDHYYVFLPSYAKLENTQIRLETSNAVFIDSVQLSDGMLCNRFALDVPYHLTYTAWGNTRQYEISFVRSGKLATMYIDTKSGNMEYIHQEKGNEETGVLRMYGDAGELEYTGSLESIKGRGNYTWSNYEKKAYSIKTVTEADLLGMGQAQNWVLLANASDPSQLRNKLSYDFANRMGLEFSPDSFWVDLFLNGEYAGVYLLSERNEVHPNRVNIDDPDSFLVSMEMIGRLEKQNYPYITTQEKQALRIHYPVSTSENERNILTKKWQSIENAILSENGVDAGTGKTLEELIDLDSWAKIFLMGEIFGDIDSGLCSHFFYYDGKCDVGKVFAGPVWDFDLSMGNRNVWQFQCDYANMIYTHRLHARAGYDTPWFYQLYQNDLFYNRITDLYRRELLPLLDDLISQRIFNYVEEVSQASAMNQIRWKISDDIHTETEYIVDYLTKRMDYLHNIWMDGTTYCLVRADQGFGTNYAYYAVLPGTCLKDLPVFEDTETAYFAGWYDAETNEPFDITKPITEDTSIYAKWEEKPSKKIGQLLNLLPLGVIAVISLGLVYAAIRKSRYT